MFTVIFYQIKMFDETKFLQLPNSSVRCQVVGKEVNRGAGYRQFRAVQYRGAQYFFRHPIFRTHNFTCAPDRAPNWKHCFLLFVT